MDYSTTKTINNLIHILLLDRNTLNITDPLNHRTTYTIWTNLDWITRHARCEYGRTLGKMVPIHLTCADDRPRFKKLVQILIDFARVTSYMHELLFQIQENRNFNSSPVATTLNIRESQTTNTKWTCWSEDTRSPASTTTTTTTTTVTTTMQPNGRGNRAMELRNRHLRTFSSCRSIAWCWRREGRR